MTRRMGLFDSSGDQSDKSLVPFPTTVDDILSSLASSMSEAVSSRRKSLAASRMITLQELVDPLTGEVHPAIAVDSQSPDRYTRKQLEKKLSMVLEVKHRYKQLIDYKVGYYLITADEGLGLVTLRETIERVRYSSELSRSQTAINLVTEDGGLKVINSLPLGLFLARKSLGQDINARVKGVYMHDEGQHFGFYVDEHMIPSHAFAEVVAPLIKAVSKSKGYKYFMVDNQYYELSGVRSPD